MVDSVNSRILTNTEYEKDESLKAKYQTYEQYLNAQLKSTSIHKFDLAKLAKATNPSDELRAFFNKRLAAFNKKSEELIENYQALAPIASSKKAEYTAYAQKIDKQDGDPSLTEESKLNKLKNESSQAEFAYDAALKSALYHTHSAVHFMA